MTIKIDVGLELRQLKLSDSIEIFNTINSEREYLGKWLPFVAFTQKLKDTENFIKSIVNASKDKFEYTFTIRLQNQFIGVIGLKKSDRMNRTTEIGYWLSEEYQKQGIVTKSVDKICDFAFKEQSFNRISIKCAVENKASSNIPKRLGFKFEGIERDGGLLSKNIFTDLEVYSKLKKD